jgi:predicted transcriptional regulator
MAKSTTMTVRVTPEVSEKLDRLARDMKRSKSYLAGEAIAAYVEHNAWQVERIKAAVQDARSCAPGIAHDDVARWVRSSDAAGELSRPAPGKRRKR